MRATPIKGSTFVSVTMISRCGKKRTMFPSGDTFLKIRLYLTTPPCCADDVEILPVLFVLPDPEMASPFRTGTFPFVSSWFFFSGFWSCGTSRSKEGFFSCLFSVDVVVVDSIFSESRVMQQFGCMDSAVGIVVVEVVWSVKADSRIFACDRPLTLTPFWSIVWLHLMHDHQPRGLASWRPLSLTRTCKL